MINRVVLVGRLVKDPELSYTPSGVAKTRFTLAVNRPFSNQQGEKEADFIQIEAWRKTAENVANFTKKGNLVGVEGAIRTGSYEGQDGKRVFFTNVNAESVQFLETRNNGDGGNAPQPNNSVQQQPSYQQQNQQQNYQRMDEDPFANSKGPMEVSEDDLPFNYRSLG